MILTPEEEPVNDKSHLFLNKAKSFTLEMRPGTSDPLVVDQVFNQKIYELSHLKRWPEIKAWCESHKPFILDAGANIGASSIYFANMIPNAIVLALEPEGKNFQLLAKNIAQNERIRGLLAALAGVNSQTGSIIDPGNGNWGYRAEPTHPPGPSVVGSEGNVVCLRPDYLLEGAKVNGLDPFLVKIDIEGAEKGVFGCVDEYNYCIALDGPDDRWIDKVPIIIVEPHDWLLPKQKTFYPVLKALCREDRDFLVQGDVVISIKHEF